MPLLVESNHATTLDVTQSSPINQYGVVGAPESLVVTPLRQYLPPAVGIRESHSRWTHLSIGAVVTAGLSALRLRFAAWPLHPLGFLLCYSYPIHRIWFSVFLGWLLKVLLVRFGGAGLYRHSRPAFTGLIVGEAGAAAFWLMVSVVLHAAGLPYRAVNLLPS